MRQSTKYRISTALLIVILLSLTLGFAFLNSNLNITGTSSINNPTWDIHFENVQVTEGSEEAEEPEIDTNRTTVTYNVVLSKPGDFYEFTVDAKNGGTIDAMIESISSTINGNAVSTIPNYLLYSTTYYDGKEITNNQLLKSGKSEKYKVRIEFKKDISSNDLPSSNEEFNIELQINTKQATQDAIEVHHAYTGTIYRWDTEELSVNENIEPNYVAKWCKKALDYDTCKGSSGYDSEEECLASIEDFEEGAICYQGRVLLTGIEEYIKEEDYPTYSDRVTHFGKDYYLKHTIENDINTKNYVCFVTDTEHCLKQTIHTEDDNKPVIEEYQSYNNLVTNNDWMSEAGCGYNNYVSWCNGGSFYRISAHYDSHIYVYKTDTEGCFTDDAGGSICRN